MLSRTLISLAAVLPDAVSFRRYPRLRELRLALVGVIDNFCYRQMSTRWRVRGIVDFCRNTQGWGTMTRKGLATQ